jgi:small Trp-rich protein
MVLAGRFAMVFIVIGVLLIGLKLADIAPVAAWSWWGVLSPFALAVAWWAYADGSGLTKRREMDKLEDKKKERRQKAMDALGIDRNRQQREDGAERSRRLAANQVEKARTDKREKNDKVVRDSVFDSQQSSGFGDSSDGAPKKKQR